jgi:hypothetical protein
MSNQEEIPQRLERCTVTASVYDGTAAAVYRWSGNDRDGRVTFDEDFADWTDHEIREHAAAMIGIEEPGEIRKIEVVWE